MPFARMQASLILKAMHLIITYWLSTNLLHVTTNTLTSTSYNTVFSVKLQDVIDYVWEHLKQGNIVTVEVLV